MLKKAAMVAGVVFLLIGVLGFVPGITTTGDDGMKRLLGLFMVDGLHNVIHLASGAAALALAGSNKTARLYFQSFGVVYGLVTVLGFVAGDGGEILGLLPVNMADNLLHLLITVAALGLGFGVPKQPDEGAHSTAPNA